jgi:hypothetical protein
MVLITRKLSVYGSVCRCQLCAGEVSQGTNVPQTFHKRSTNVPQTFHKHSTNVPQTFHNSQFVPESVPSKEIIYICPGEQILDQFKKNSGTIPKRSGFVPKTISESLSFRFCESGEGRVLGVVVWLCICES